MNKLIKIVAPAFMIASIGCAQSGPINIAGQIVDSDTGKPAARCRVIVTIRNLEGTATDLSERYGLEADSQGKVSSVINPTIEYTHIKIEVCSVSGQYAVMGWPKKNFTLRTGDIPEKYMRLYTNSLGEAWMTYDQFAGAKPLGRLEKIRFYGSGWNAYRRPPIRHGKLPS